MSCAVGIQRCLWNLNIYIHIHIYILGSSQSHKPFESGTANWLMESMERLRLAMGEFVKMWGDVETYIVDHLNEMADAALRREMEIKVNLACNTPGSSTRNKEKEFHIAEVWFLISCLADTLQNGPDAAKLLQRDLFHPVAGKIPKLRQQPFHPTAGILWHDTRLRRCDYISQQRKRKKEAERLFWGQ